MTFTPIDYPGAYSTTVWGLSDRDEVVGYFEAGSGSQSFVYDGATFTLIEPPGTIGTFAHGISPDGTKLAGGFVDAGGRYGFLATLVSADITPPAITVSASPATLSPPNGKLVDVRVSGMITDESGVQTSTYQVTDDYDQIQPSGPFTPDEADGSYAFTVDLQASRNGNDRDGRRYTIEVSATDHAGNVGRASTSVTVPRK